MCPNQKRLEQENVQTILSLTPLQEGMLFHYRQNPESYFEQLSLQISGQVDLGLMEEAWGYVIKSNEMLRTVFKWEKLARPVQVVLKEGYVPIRFYDLSACSQAEQENSIAAITAGDCSEPIDISTEPFRVTIIKQNNNQCVMIISNHHILYDGWSNGVILKEFLQAYNALSVGQPLQVESKSSFKEFIKWLQSQDQSRLKEYWANYLAGFDTKTVLPSIPEHYCLHVPGDAESPIASARQDLLAVGRHSIELSEKLTQQINQFVGENRVTLAAFFYTVWGIILQKYTNSSDIVFGTPVSGRNAAVKGIEEMVGLYWPREFTRNYGWSSN